MSEARFTWINAAQHEGRLGRLFDSDQGKIVLEGISGGTVFGDPAFGQIICRALNHFAPLVDGNGNVYDARKAPVAISDWIPFRTWRRVKLLDGTRSIPFQKIERRTAKRPAWIPLDESNSGLFELECEIYQRRSPASPNSERKSG